MCAVIAEHNLAFVLVDHLIPVLKDISDDPDCREIWRKMSLLRHDVPKILDRDIVSPYKNDVARILRDQKFTIQFDSSTDQSATSVSCVLINYVNFEKRRIINSLWDMPETLEQGGEHRATAMDLVGMIQDSFQIHSIDVRNIRAFSSDGCNSMFGNIYSLAVILEERIGEGSLIIVKKP